MSIKKFIVHSSLFIVLTSCAAPRQVMTRDTLYQSNVHYDSIYIDNWQYVEHRADTVFTEKVKREYKYKLLRDTIYRVHTDTIPYEVTIVETKEITRPLTWFDHLTRATFFLLIGFLAFWLYRLIQGR